MKDWKKFFLVGIFGFVLSVCVVWLYKYSNDEILKSIIPAIFGLLGVVAGSIISIVQIKEETKRQKNNRLFEAKRLAYEKANAQFAKMQRLKFDPDEDEKDFVKEYKEGSGVFDAAMSQLFLYAGVKLEKLVQKIMVMLMTTVKAEDKDATTKQKLEIQDLRMDIIKEMRTELEVLDYQDKF